MGKSKRKGRKKKRGYVNVFPNTLAGGGPLVCLPIQRRGEGAGSLMIFFFGAPLRTPPRPPPPAYSCRGAPCAWNVNEAAGLHPPAGLLRVRGHRSPARLPWARPAPHGLARPTLHSSAPPKPGVPQMGSSLSSPAGSGMAVGCTAVTDVTANRFASSSAVVSAFLNLLPFLKLRESCNIGHLLHYRILGNRRREGGRWAPEVGRGVMDEPSGL